MTVIDAEIPPIAHWRKALAEGRLLLQRDPATGKAVFPPRQVAPGGGDLEWIEAAGTGTVYSVTVIRPRPPAEPYNVVLVDLDEGVRVFSHVEGIGANDVVIGMPVRAAIGEARHDGQGDDGPLLVFHPA